MKVKCKEFIIILYTPRESKLNSDKGFIIIDNESQGGTHWTCFIIKDNKSYYYDSYDFGGLPDKFLTKSIT